MEKRELFEKVINTEFAYRTYLEIDKPFGVEIELGLYDEYDKLFVLDKNLRNSGWTSGEDVSITGPIKFEIQSPVYTGNIETWKTFSELSERLRRVRPNFTTSSFQTNLDINLDNRQMIYFFKFFCVFEKIIYRLSKGEDRHLRVNGIKNARSIRDMVMRKLYYTDDIKDIINDLRFNKIYAFSLKSKNNGVYNVASPISIIEFRTPNCTYNKMLWQSYINTFYHIIDSFEKNKIDYELIDYLYERVFGNVSYDSYEGLDINKAILFSEMIFDTEEDQMYFFKHYIGNDVDKVCEQYELKRR